MPRRITIIQGHPDPDLKHFGYALGDAYQKGAEAGGHEVRQIRIAGLDFPILRSQAEWEGIPAPAIASAEEAIAWADHLVILFPLWLGTMPALLKGFLEQVLRPGFTSKGGKRPLKGKTARIVITMGMPAFIYRWFYFAHGLRGLERNVLAFCGIRRIRESLIGMVEGSVSSREKWLAKMGALGRAGK